MSTAALPEEFTLTARVESVQYGSSMSTVTAYATQRGLQVQLLLLNRDHTIADFKPGRQVTGSVRKNSDGLLEPMGALRIHD